MALATATLSAKIKAELIVVFGAADDVDKLQKFSDAIAKAVVDEIKANAVVNTTVTTPDTINGTGIGTVS